MTEAGEKKACDRWGFAVSSRARGNRGGYLWFQSLLNRSLPEIDGEISLSGINEEIRLIRDAYGMPHIYAENEADLFFGQGFAMAQDRFWQMDFYRRVGRGRISEIFGADFLEVDRYFRMITAAGMNREIPEEAQFILNSFSQGVNAYLETHRDRLPLEFRFLRYEPDPWTPEDTFFILKMISWGLSCGWRVDLTAARILAEVGEEKFREAFPVEPGEAVVSTF